MRWMDTPAGILNAYVTMLPVLRAEDCLRNAQVVAMGSGTLDKPTRRETLREWNRDAQAFSAPEAEKPDPETRRMMIESVGITYG